MSFQIKKIQYAKNEEPKYLLIHKYGWFSCLQYGPFQHEVQAYQKMQDLIGYPKTLMSDYYDNKGRRDHVW